MTPAARVARYVRAAMKSLPAEFATRLDNVEIVVQRRASRLQRRRSGGGGDLYGLYEGVPLAQRGSWYGNVTPDKVTIFWEPLVRDFPDDADLREQVRRTVYHEIAHHFGFTDEELLGLAVE
ncbi:MAG TPA: metallopeptidase family protein [Dehalococcoidia bacterium]|nr:metallopeptidase family protein [Dehalococcoidia bacterium]